MHARRRREPGAFGFDRAQPCAARFFDELELEERVAEVEQIERDRGGRAGAFEIGARACEVAEGGRCAGEEASAQAKRGGVLEARVRFDRSVGRALPKPAVLVYAASWTTRAGKLTLNRARYVVTSCASSLW